ncbi:RsbS, negative regulator of sigma-B [Minicystis rosea]|nr:RsbS, negative regulator of sigma-B [Minicystis rosea]
MDINKAGAMMIVERTVLVRLNPMLVDAAVRELRAVVSRTLEEQSLQGLVLDLTSVDAMDSYITRCIRDLAVSARLMGVPTIVCGVQPAVADTLVEMGMTLGDVLTTLNIDAALRALRAPRNARSQA